MNGKNRPESEKGNDRVAGSANMFFRIGETRTAEVGSRLSGIGTITIKSLFRCVVGRLTEKRRGYIVPGIGAYEHAKMHVGSRVIFCSTIVGGQTWRGRWSVFLEEGWHGPLRLP